MRRRPLKLLVVARSSWPSTIPTRLDAQWPDGMPSYDGVFGVTDGILFYIGAWEERSLSVSSSLVHDLLYH